jgi:hypothetical protein
VRFTVNAQGGTGVYGYAWAFGDGATSTASSPTHVYSAAGDYLPTVQVTSGAERVSCSNPVAVAPPATPTFPLTVSRLGTGSGRVTSSPSGIDCGSTCAASYPQGTTVSLTAQPDAGSSFVGWTGACSGTGTCNVAMDAARSVSARFDLRNFTLNLVKTPLGLILGSVTSSPAGINCGLLCANASASYPSGTVVTLNASAILTALFQGWGGDCSGGGSCVITMDGDKSVTAAFLSLGLFGTSQTPSGGDLDLGLMRSVLKSPGARGDVTVNGRTVLVAGEGEGQVAVQASPGNNLVEAWVREATRPGVWQFEFDPAAIEPGSLQAVAGEPVAVGPSSISFRLSGRSGERLSFAFRAAGGRAGPSSR